MNLYMYVFPGLLLTLILNLIAIAARSGLRNANLARVLQIRDEIGAQGDRALTLMSATSRPYAGMHFLQAICRFLLIGFLLQLILIGNETWAFGWKILTLLLAGLLIALLEWVVERHVAQDSEAWVIRLSFFIRALTFVFYPFISLSLWLSRDNALPQESNSFVTEEELKLMVEAGQQEGVLEQEEGQMIFSIFQLSDTLTREIMVPRIEMLALEINTPLSLAIDTFLDSGYSRVPVYDGRVDNIMGIFYAKDLLKVQREGNGVDQSIRSLLRDPYFVPEAKKADELLAEMQLRRVHMAIVVDEYGGVAGVVTLEDIIEEILGEIQDEYDVEDLPFQLLDDGSYLFRGRIDIDDFNHITDSSLPPEEADTLSGFIYGRLGHVPVAGESVQIGELVLSVEQVSNRRIRTVRARLDSSEGKQDVN